MDAQFLGAAFRKLRREADLSQEAVAHAAGISTRHYQDVEAGRKAVSVQVGSRIARATDHSLQYVLELAERMGAK